MTTMRERLCVAAVRREFAVKGIDMPDAAFGLPQAVDAAVETYGDIIDAVLAELRAPDDAMIRALVDYRVQKWSSITGQPVETITLDDSVAIEWARTNFVAMIDAIK